MQYKFINFLHSMLLGLGVTVYVTSAALLILINERSEFIWLGLGTSGVLAVVSGYRVVYTGKHVLFTESRKMLPTIVFSMGCIIIPVITLIIRYGG